MKKYLLFIVLLLIPLACNLPNQVAVSSPPPVEIQANEGSTQVIAPSATSAPEATATIAPTNTVEVIPPTATQAATVVPSDLPFNIDCSALPASRQVDCDAFITSTRDQVYPIYREITGISLSKCYKSINYIILPTDPLPGAGGISDGGTITYNQSYSIDLPHQQDVHELLHTISRCAKALDDHVLHGLMMNYVYDRMGIHDSGYFLNKNSEDFTVNLPMLIEKAKTVSGGDLKNICRGILASKTTLAFFVLGKDVAKPIYESTFSPPKLATPPNPKLTSIWGSEADQVEALLETLKQNYKYEINIPECGY